MVQIIPARRTPFSDAMLKDISGNLGESFGAAVRGKKTKQQELATEQFLKEHGYEGLKDPTMQKIAVQEILKGEEKRKTIGGRKSYLDEILGKKTRDGITEIGEEPKETKEFGIGSPEQKEPGKEEEFDFTKIPDEKIAMIAVEDKELGEILRKNKESQLEQQRHKEKLKAGERKEFRESYEGKTGDFINETYNKYEDAMRREAIFERMEQLEDSGKLSQSGVINLLQQLGLKEEWIQNPANEEYTKLSLDLLGGGTLQADYGSKVLQSEFHVSQQRIPTLSQTPEGRKQIRENMELTLLPAKLKKERMQFYLDKSELTGDPLPPNLRGKILKDIQPQLEEAYDKFKQRNGRYKVKEGTKLDENAYEKYFFLAEGNVEEAKKMMKEDGYDVP